MPITTRISLLGGVLALVGTASACGGDDGNDEVAAETTTAVTITTADESTTADDNTTDASTTVDETTATTEATTETTAESTETTAESTTESTSESTESTSADTSTDADTSSSSGEDGPIPCDIADADLVPVVPEVMLVLDKSGSMIQNSWDHDNDPMTAAITRWKSLHAVVTGVLNGYETQFDFGAQLFPSKLATNEYNQNACLVENPPEVFVAPTNATEILLEIPTANSVNIRGGTPAAAGMISAIDHLVAVGDGDPQAIVLITDGAANCRLDAQTNAQRFESYDVNLPPILSDAFNNLGIATYVIGIDISGNLTAVSPDGEPDNIVPFDKLNELALAGGKPKGGPEEFYQANNQIELDAALQAIIDDATSCTVLLDPAPAFPDLLQVVVDGMVIPMVDDCANNAEGWVYTNPMGPYDSLELCGASCELSVNAEFVKAEYYCDPG
jgi:hypothetical protein